MDRKLSEINKVYEKVINNGLLLGILFGVFSYTLSWLNISTRNFLLGYYIGGFVLLSFSVVYHFRKKIPLGFKSIIISLGLAFIFVPEILKFGLISSAKMLVILVPLFSLFKL